MADTLTDALTEHGLKELLAMRLVKTVNAGVPVAGGEWFISVPGGVFWEILTVKARLITSAVVANRVPALVLNDGDTFAVGRYPAAAAQVASTTVVYTWSAGYGDHNNPAASTAALPTPALLGLQSWSVQSVTTAIDAGDQWGIIVLTVREWSPDQIAQQTQWITRNLGTTIPYTEAVR